MILKGAIPAHVHSEAVKYVSFATGSASSHLLNEVNSITDGLATIDSRQFVSRGIRRDLLRATGSIRPTMGMDRLPHAGVDLVGVVAFGAGLEVVTLHPTNCRGPQVTLMKLTVKTKRDNVSNRDLEGAHS